MLLLLPLVTTKKPLSRSVGRSWWRNPRHVYYTTSVQQESWRKNTTYTRKHTLITTETKSHTCRNCQSELSVLVTPSLSTPTHPCCGSLQIFRNNQAPAAPRYCCCCKTSLPTTTTTTAAAGSPTPATLLPQPFFFFFFSQLGTCFKQLSETLQANQEAAAACACARSKLSEPGEGLT